MILIGTPISLPNPLAWCAFDWEYPFHREINMIQGECEEDVEKQMRFQQPWKDEEAKAKETGQDVDLRKCHSSTKNRPCGKTKKVYSLRKMPLSQTAGNQASIQWMASPHLCDILSEHSIAGADTGV